MIAVSVLRQRKSVSPEEWAFFLKPEGKRVRRAVLATPQIGSPAPLDQSSGCWVSPRSQKEGRWPLREWRGAVVPLSASGRVAH